MIAFPCRSCNTQLHRHDTEAGSKIICPSCGQQLQVPQAAKDQETDNKPLRGLSPQSARRASDGLALVRFVCPHCRASIKARADKAGALVSCPGCKLPLEIPSPKTDLLEEQKANVQPSLDSFSSRAADRRDDSALDQLSRKQLAAAGAAASTDSQPYRAELMEPEGQTNEPAKSSSMCSARGLVQAGAVIFLVLAGFIAVTAVGAILARRGAGNSSSVDAAKSNNSHGNPTVATMAPAAFTESAAIERMKTVLNAWTGRTTPRSLVQLHPNIDFSDSYFTDGVTLLRFDVERTQLYRSSGSCEVWTRLVTRRVDGGECRYTRVYDVKSPNEKGVWRIEVSSVSPPGPGVAEVNPPRETTRPGQGDIPGFNPIPSIEPPSQPAKGMDLPGRVCASCRGTGFTDMRCGNCGGSGLAQSGGICRYCNGMGLRKCAACSGRGTGGGGGFVP